MRGFATLAFSVLLVFTLSVAARADLISQYGINQNGVGGINDANDSWDNINLYQLFNEYFADQLLVPYTSSNDLFNERGVDPNTTWTTNGSQMVGAFNVSAFGHEMSIVDSLGNNHGSIFSVSGSTNSVGGIGDLSGQSVTYIPDGLEVSFRLDAYLDYWDNASASVHSSHAYTWSSNQDENADGMIHMLALDITDLYNTKHGTDNSSVFMFVWEDLSLFADWNRGFWAADWDYQDLVVIMTNVKPNNPNAAVPEPATLAVLGLGLAGLGLARARRRE